MKYLKLRECRWSMSRAAFVASRRCGLVGVGALIIIGLFWHTAVAAPAASPDANISNADSSLSTLSHPVWDGKTLLFHTRQGTLAVTAVCDDVIRVHFTTADSSVRDDSFAVVHRHWTE